MEQPVRIGDLTQVPILVWIALALFAAGGILAYTGVWRSWAHAGTGPPHAFVFALVLVPLSLPLIAIGSLLGEVGGVVFALLALGCFVMIPVSFFWFPKWALPAWFKARKGIG